MTASPKEILSESPDNFYHMGGVRKAAPPPPIFIPPKINQVTANVNLSSSTGDIVKVRKRRASSDKGGAKKAVRTRAPTPTSASLAPLAIGKRKNSGGGEVASKKVRTKAPTPTSASLAPLAIGKRKNEGGGEEASKRVKTVAHRNIKGLKINVAGLGGVPTTGPLSASAKPKSSDQLPKRNPTRAVKIKVTPKPKNSKGVSKKRK